MAKKYNSLGYTCRDGSFDTSKKYVKILYFRHFSKHFVFTDKGVNYRNKELKKYVEVSVVADIECVDTI